MHFVRKDHEYNAGGKRTDECDCVMFSVFLLYSVHSAKNKESRPNATTRNCSDCSVINGSFLGLTQNNSLKKKITLDISVSTLDMLLSTLDFSVSTLDISVSTLDMLLSTLDSRQLPRLLVLQFCNVEGKAYTLHRTLHSRTLFLKNKEWFGVILQLLEPLKVLHNSRLIHQDIKGDNILLTYKIHCLCQ